MKPRGRAASRHRATRLAACVLALSVAGGCVATREQSGAVIGGATGAAVGSTIGHGSGQVLAIILGAMLGTAVGADVGRQMDEYDRIRAAEAMEYNRSGEAYDWRNPDSQRHYRVVPRRTYDGPGGPCREFTLDADIGRRPEQVYGTACRQPDGTWRIVK